MLYLIGSLRNPKIPLLTRRLEEEGISVFSAWFAAGERADDAWQEYEKSQGVSYAQALTGVAAQHVYQFDLHWLNRCNSCVLVMPAGKSGHIELGYMIGQGKPGWVLFDREPERWDVMYAFTQGIFFDDKTLIDAVRGRVK